MKDIRNLSDYEQIEWQRQVIREEIEEGVYVSDNDFNWLIQQAERVVEVKSSKKL